MISPSFSLSNSCTDLAKEVLPRDRRRLPSGRSGSLVSVPPTSASPGRRWRALRDTVGWDHISKLLETKSTYLAVVYCTGPRAAVDGLAAPQVGRPLRVDGCSSIGSGVRCRWKFSLFKAAECQLVSTCLRGQDMQAAALICEKLVAQLSSPMETRVEWRGEGIQVLLLVPTTIFREIPYLLTRVRSPGFVTVFCACLVVVGLFLLGSTQATYVPT